MRKKHAGDSEARRIRRCDVNASTDGNAHAQRVPADKQKRPTPNSPNSANLPVEGQVAGVPRDFVGAGRREKNRALYPRGWLLLAVATNVVGGTWYCGNMNG